MVAGDVHRDRRVRHGGVSAHRSSGAPHATRSRRDGRSRRLGGALRCVVADPRRRRRLGFGTPPRPLPDRTPDRLRVHRRAGGSTARRAADEGALPPRRVGIRGGLPGRRPPRDSAARSARVDGAPAPGHGGCTARVPRPPHRHRMALSGGPRRHPGVRARGRPATAPDPVRLRAGPAPPRVSGAVRDGLTGRRLPPLRPCCRAVQRGRADALSVRVHGAAQPGGHPFPRPSRRAADAAIRAAARTVPEPRRCRRRARRDGRRRSSAGRSDLRPLRASGRAPYRRHRDDRRHYAHVDQCRVSDRPRRGACCRASGRGGHWGSRCDRCDRPRPARPERAPPRSGRGDRVRPRAGSCLDGRRRERLSVVQTSARR